MSTRWLSIALSCGAIACAGGGDPGTPDAGASSTPDAGTVSGPTWSAPAAIDATSGAGLDLVTARAPSGLLAAAYFVKQAAGKYDLVVAREADDGSWSTETVQAGLTGHFGLALAFDPQGNPAVSYVGGGTADAEGDGRWHDFDTGQSLPSDAVVATRGAGGWTPAVVARLSGDIVSTGFPIDDKGVVVGLAPALAFGADGTQHLVVRDIHYGSDESATAASNLEYRRGTAGELVAGGPSDPDHLQGAGNATRMVLAEGEPALSFVLSPASVDDATQVWFARRSADGWKKVQVSSANGRPGNPPALAWAKDQGFALAFYDAEGGDLVVARSADGAEWDSSAVEALGDTGLHPGLAYGKDGSLGVLYAFCRGATEPATPCSTKQELRFRLRGTRWGAAERVDGTVPEQASLEVDREGRFVGIWRSPKGGVFAARRTP